MKTMLVILAMVFGLNAMAQQYSVPVIHPKNFHKATALPANPELGETCAPDHFAMVNGQMRTYKGCVLTYMTNYRWLKNETVVMPDGKIVTNSGKKLYLKDGESIDGNGVITSGRCREISGSDNGGTCMIK
jgi:hypothetical protein